MNSEKHSTTIMHMHSDIHNSQFFKTAMMISFFMLLVTLSPGGFINNAAALAPYGTPTYNPATDAGLFLWKNTDESWSLRGSAGGTYSQFQGNVTADQPYTSIVPYSIEAHDVLDTSNPNVIGFNIQMWGSSEDGFDFTLPAGAAACFSVDLPAGSTVTVGDTNTVVTTPFDLSTLGPCGAGSPTLSIDDITVNENAGTAIFTVTLSAASAVMVNVDVATADGSAIAPDDYTALSTTILTFNPGVTSQTVTIPIFDNTVSESTENFTVNLSNAINATISKASGAGTIVDDDLSSCGAPSIDPAVDGAVFLWQDCGTNQWYLRATAGTFGTLAHKGNLSSDLGFTSVFPYSLEASDTFDTTDPNQIVFILQVGSPWDDGFDFELPAGTNTCLSMDVPGGSSPPAQSSVFLGANRHPVTPPLNLENFGPCGLLTPTISVTDITVGEADGVATFVVALSPASTEVVSVDISTSDGTAIAPGDYAAVSTTSLSFNPGETSKTVNVAIVNDTAAEGQETFTLNLGNAVNANLATIVATGTITDDDLSACGTPTYDGATEGAIFLWQNCSTGQWQLRATAGAAGFAQYAGNLASSTGFATIAPVSLEPSDVFDTSNPNRIDFNMQMWSPWSDGFDFTLQAGADACLTIDTPSNTPILLGSSKSQVTSSVNLTTLLPCAPTPPPSAYNFVVILTDDQRWDSLWAMPILQQELLNRGVEFTNAFITTPLCCPARASFLSGGFYAHNTGVLEGLSDNGGELKFRQNDDDTLATNMQAAGYKTMLAGGKYMNDYRQPYVPPGWNTFVNNNIGPYSANWFNFDVTVGSSTTSSTTGTRVSVSQYVTNYHRDQVLSFLDGVGNSPFFIYFSVFAPHATAIPDIGDENLFPTYLYRGRSYGETDLSDKPDWLANPNRFLSIKQGDDEFHRDQLRSLQSVDRAIGAIVDKIEAKGLLNNTVFIFTSDNGFMWGEHGVYTKGMAYEESIRVPFIVVMPGITPRQESAMIAANLDIGATMYDLAGINKNVDGISLVPLLQNTNAPWRSDLIFQHWGPHEGSFGTWSAIRTEDYKYIENAIHEKELYDLVNDPLELDSKHNDPAYASIKTNLAAQLESRRGLAVNVFVAPAGNVGVPYNFEIKAWGGQTPYTWMVSEGTLPQGLSLNSTTGVISGTPTQTGTQQVKVKIQDSSIATHTGMPQQIVAPGYPKVYYQFVINP